MRVVIIGGSFGGLTTAFELRKLLGPHECEITLISKDQRFVFIPSLPWVAMGSQSLERISMDLDQPLARKKIRFVRAAVQNIDAQSKQVFTDAGDHTYDYLVIATGHRSANEAVPGLGPFDGPGHSLMSPPEAEEAREAVKELLRKPGPIVVGCAPGASCIGPAYEFAFEIDHLLRKRAIRHKVPISLVTPEPFLGHFGVGGVGKARQYLEGELEARDIRYLTSAAVSKITPTSVELAGGQTLESRFSLIIPPLGGVKAVAASAGLANPKGFIATDEYFRHRQFKNIYAVGVAVALPPVEELPVPVNFPKTAHMTEQMAAIAARSIAAEARGSEPKSHDLHVECILDMGDKAVHMKADPVRPPRNVAKVSAGWHWLIAKRLFERFYLWRARRGETAALHGWGW